MDRVSAVRELALRPVEWSETVAAHMRAALAEADEHDPITDDWLHGECKAGQLALVAAFQGEVHVATAAYRVERTDDRMEMVIVACGAGLSGLHVVQHFLSSLETMAEFARCQTVRFHTRRRGLIKLAGGQGYHYAETIMRKVLGDGQQE